jgi:hypothetical protein
VKKALKIALLSTLSLMFYFLLSTNISNTNSLASNTTKENTPQKEQIKSIDTPAFAFSNRTSFGFSVAKNNANTTFKTFSNAVFSYHTKAIERLLKVTFKHYTLHSKNELYRLSQSKILFPFHYFW